MSAAPFPAPHTPGGDDLIVAPSQPRPGLLLVRVLGELGRRSAPRCARVLRGAVGAAAAERRARTGHARVVCDLTGVDSVGASGLDVLVEADAYARTEDVELVVVLGAGRVRAQLLGLDRRLRLADRLADAVPGPGPRSGR